MGIDRPARLTNVSMKAGLATALSNNPIGGGANRKTFEKNGIKLNGRQILELGKL